MKGLILKDLIALKRQAKILAVLFVFYLFLSVATDNISFFGGVVAVLCAILPVTAMSYDERCQWDKYALTMPVSRADLVLSKYLLGALFCIAALIINFLFNWIAGSSGLQEALLVSLSLSSVGLFFLSLLLPILFKFGVEKGRMLMMMVLFLPTAVIVFLSTRGIPMPEEKTLDLLFSLLSPAAILLFVLSIFLSMRIYRKKEVS